MLFSAVKAPTATAQPAQGDWIVTGEEIVENENIVLDGNLVVKSGGSLTLRNTTLKMNVQYDGQYGISVESEGSLFIYDSNMISNSDYRFAFIVRGANFVMKNSELNGCGWGTPGEESETSGLYVDVDNALIDGNLISMNYNGIILAGDSIALANNTIHSSGFVNVVVLGSNNIVTNNRIFNPADTLGLTGFWGHIHLTDADNNIIENNTISESPTFGIHLDYSWNNVIENNTIFNISYPGIDIQLSSNNIIRNNTIFDIKEGGIRLLPRSFNNIIEHNSIRRANYDGIELNYADNNILANNEINDVGYGILMYGSSNNAIVNNNISKGDRGITLYISSENNTIRSNTISSFYWGISLHYSSDGNIITNNDIFSYDSSILLDNSSRNIVYHNNFVGNDKAYDNGSNQWDYNYWGDYTGLDTDGDGIGDEAYYIYPNGVDNHPLMNPMAFELSQVPRLHPIAYKEIWEEPYRITGEQTIENETIRVSTRIDVTPSSTLTLRNVTLIIESGGWSAGICVNTGGSLFIYQSVITGKGFTVVARPNSTFVMGDSELHGCGVSLVESLKILTDGAVVENNLITNSHEGVCIFSSSCRVVNNRILSTFRGISIEGSGNIIMNNTIIGCVEDGIFVYGARAVNNTITNNFISDVWRDCIGGGDVAENNVIMGNTLSNSPPDEFGPAKFTFSNLSINPTEVEAGNTVLVSVKVTNIGKQEGSYTIELKIADEFVDNKTVTLEGGGSTTVSFTVIKEAGSYDVDVGGQTGTLVVKAIPGEGAPPAEGIPIVYVVAGVVAIVAAIGLVFMLRKR